MRTGSAGPYPTTDQIAERAHELFISGGRRVSMIREYWRAAERELLLRAADRFFEAQRDAGPRPLKSRWNR